jgi:MFS family permease
MLSINGSIYHPPAYSLTSDLFEGKKRSKAFGYFSMGEKVSVGIGIITFSIMYGFFHIGWRYVYLIWALPILLSSLIIWKIKIPKKEVQNENLIQTQKKSTEKGEKIFKGFSMSFILLLVYISIVTISGALYSNFLSIYFIDEKGLDLPFVSLLFTIGSLSGIISSPLGGYFASKLGDKKWTIISRSINLSLLGLFAISPSNILAIFFFLLFEFAGSLPAAARATLIARLAPERRKGLGYSLSFIPGWVMGSLGSVIGASVAVTFGLWSLFPLAFCILSVGILILIFGIKSE